MEDERPVIEYQSRKPKVRARRTAEIVCLALALFLILVLIAGVFLPVFVEPGRVTMTPRIRTSAEI